MAVSRHLMTAFHPGIASASFHSHKCWQQFTVLAEPFRNRLQSRQISDYLGLSPLGPSHYHRRGSDIIPCNTGFNKNDFLQWRSHALHVPVPPQRNRLCPGPEVGELTHASPSPQNWRREYTEASHSASPARHATDPPFGLGIPITSSETLRRGCSMIKVVHAPTQ